MTISISQIIADTKKFEQAQLKEFKQFIGISKKLKGATETVQQQVQERWSQMSNEVKTLKDAEKNDQSPLLILQADAAYMKALEPVQIFPTDLNKPKQSEAYMKDFIKRTEQEMKQREAQYE